MDVNVLVQIIVGGVQLLVIVATVLRVHFDLMHKIIPESLARLQETSEKDRKANKKILRKIGKLQEAFNNYITGVSADQRPAAVARRKARRER